MGAIFKVVMLAHVLVATTAILLFFAVLTDRYPPMPDKPVVRLERKKKKKQEMYRRVKLARIKDLFLFFFFSFPDFCHVVRSGKAGEGRSGDQAVQSQSGGKGKRRIALNSKLFLN